MEKNESHAPKNGERTQSGPSAINLFSSLYHWLADCCHIGKQNRGSLEEAVSKVVSSYQDSEEPLSHDEQGLLENIFAFGKLTAHDICIPRGDIVAVPLHATQEELVEIFVKEEHSRIPAYDESIDHIKGFIHVKDLMPLLAKQERCDVIQLLREILFVPPSMRLIDLLIKMRSSRVHMAIVLDEYGGTEGLVTIEDVLEKITGHIEDEHDEDTQDNLVVRNGKTLEISGRMPLEELESLLAFPLASDEVRENCHTIGGLLCMLFSHVPTIKETITHPAGVIFTVLDADPRRIKRVRIEKEDHSAFPESAPNAPL